MIKTLLIALFLCSTMQAQTLDSYGGMENAPSIKGATGYFRVEKSSKGRWLFVDPIGNYMFRLGVYDLGTYDGGKQYIAAVQNKFAPGGSLFPWMPFVTNACLRLKNWGFNSLTAASEYALPVGTYGRTTYNTAQMPFVVFPIISHNAIVKDGIHDVIYGTDASIYTGWPAKSPDLFDAKYTKSAFFQMYSLAGIYTDSLDASPWLVGTIMDNADEIYGLRTNDAVHLGWVTAATAPSQTYNSSFAQVFKPFLHGASGTTYPNPEVYVKHVWATWLQSKYGTIDELNRVWGSDYVSFGSAAAPRQAQMIWVADGINTTVQATISHVPITGRSVKIFSNGSLVGGDVRSLNGGLGGDGIKGTIDYSTGDVSLAFNYIPDAGTIFTMSFTTWGWPRHITGSKGLLDEDGSSPWIGRDFTNLSDAAPAVRSDMELFLSNIATQYFATVTGAVRTVLPHHLVFSPSAMSGIMRNQVMAAMSKYVDVIELAVHPDGLDRFGITPSIQRIWESTSRPIEIYALVTANAASSLSGHVRSATTDYPTQADRGAAYAALMSTSLNWQSSNGIFPVAGFDYWAWSDKLAQQEDANFGLVSAYGDNAYDGRQDQVDQCVDQWGYPCGGEPGDYGDFLSSVIAANKSAISVTGN